MKEKLEYYEKKYERNPVEDAIKAISNKWTLHILRDLYHRKNTLQRIQSKQKNTRQQSTIKMP